MRYNKKSGNLSDDNLRLADDAIQTMAGFLENLSDKTETLPRVDPDGSSECPWAEDKYAEKEEMIKKVKEQLQELEIYLDITCQIINQHQGNIEQVRTDKETLYSNSAKDGYSFAEMTAEHHLREAIERQTALKGMISWAEKVLSLAAEKQFPGRKPKKSNHSATLPGGSHSQSSTFDAKGSVNSGIDNLISMGPLG